MNARLRGERWLRWLFLSLGIIVPTLSLVPLGSLWLWQNGYLLHWALAACLTVAAFYVLQRRIFDRAEDAAPAEASTDRGETDDAAWTPLEQQAWADVRAIAAAARPAELDSREAVGRLGLDTISAVAKRLHPEVKDPLWRFTAPEALSIIERVSARLRGFLNDTAPFSDRLTVAQALALYRWRGAVEVAEKAYDVWRFVRLANPVNAATQEVRERLSREMVRWGRKHVARVLIETYVQEVGRAAIDLYGGRLRVSDDDLASHVTGASQADLKAIASRIEEPLRILVAGQTGAGKSRLVDAMVGRPVAAVGAGLPTTSYTAHQIARPDWPAALVIDTPGLGTRRAAVKDLVAKARGCDLVLWVVSGQRADRGADRDALDQLRAAFVRDADRRHPPLLVALDRSGADLARWTAREDPGDDAAMSDVADLAAGLQVEPVDVVAIELAADGGIESLWRRLAEALPRARQVQTGRLLRDARASWRVGRMFRQAGRAGRLIARTVASRRSREEK